MNGCALPADFDATQATQTLNRWIAHETARATREVTEAIEAYRFNDAAASIYRFVWNVYCDWYLELAKPVLMGEEGTAKSETLAMVAWARDEILKLLHPFMPFITEELWAVTADSADRHVSPRAGDLLALAQWPSHKGLDDEAAEAEIGWVVDLVTAIRSLRAEMNIAPATMIPLALVNVSDETKSRAGRWTDVIKRLARAAEIGFETAPPSGAVQLLVRGEVAALPLKGIVDVAAERARLQKEIAKADGDIKHADNKLNNPKFVANAEEAIVEAEREKRDEAAGRRAKIVEAMERLKAAE
jgi:valyl-tRNA synthetase